MSAERRLALLQLVHFTLYLLNLLLLAVTGEKDEARLAVAVGAQVRAVNSVHAPLDNASRVARQTEWRARIEAHVGRKYLFVVNFTGRRWSA